MNREDKIKLLYIFTSGTFNSANNKQWFRIFKDYSNLKISILISECDNSEKISFLEKYENRYNIVYFKNLKTLLRVSWIKRIKYILHIARIIDNIAPDIIHIHGCYYSYLIKPLFFIKCKPKIIFNIWGNDYNTIYYQRLKSRLIMNWVFKKSDLIWTNWFSMADDLKNKFPKYITKIKIIIWGVESDIFSSCSDKVYQKIIEHFQLDKDQYIILYAKGFAHSNNQKALLEALKYVEASLNFKVILHSSRKDDEIDRQYQEIIERNHLQDKVIISHHFFLDDEMKALYKIADLSLVLSQKDQITRTITEAIFAESNLLLNNIAPYRYLCEYYGFNLDFTEAENHKKLAKQLEKYIKTKPIPNWIYEKSILRKIFDFESKSDVYFSIYQNLLQERSCPE